MSSMNRGKGIRKIDMIRLNRADRKGYFDKVEVAIRVDIHSGEFSAEYAGRKFSNTSLPGLHREIKDHDNDLEKLKWIPVICLRTDWSPHTAVEVLGVNYWRMFKASAGKKKGTVWRTWKGDAGGRFKEADDDHLDVLEVGQPGEWVSGNGAETMLPYDVETWQGLRTLSRMEAELKAKLEEITTGKKRDLVAFLLRASKGAVQLLGDGAGKETP